jgi:hypothetical protein
VIAFGLVGSGLLSTRQSRLQAGHEVTAARLRIREHDERLLRLRAEIAGYVSPAAVHDMIAVHDELGDLRPIAERVRTLPAHASMINDAPLPDGSRADGAFYGTEPPSTNLGTAHAP